MESRGFRKATALAASVLMHLPLVILALHSSERSLLELIRTETDVQFIATVFFLQDPSAVDAEGFAFEPAFEATQSITIPVPALPDLSAVAADSFEDAQQIRSAEEFAKIEQLQGIYTRQLTDRITRVLQMTTARNEAPADPCVVHVVQNENGDVIEVDTQECKRSASARETLANAIRAASPLPPPPQGLAMGSYLTIDATLL